MLDLPIADEFMHPGMSGEGCGGHFEAKIGQDVELIACLGRGVKAWQPISQFRRCAEAGSNWMEVKDAFKDGQRLFVVVLDRFEGRAVFVAEAYARIAVVLHVEKRVVFDLGPEILEFGLAALNLLPDAEEAGRNGVLAVDFSGALKEAIDFFAAAFDIVSEEQYLAHQG